MLSERRKSELRKLGREAGRSAASWVDIDDEAVARKILAGMDDGDPMVLDALPYPNLSGEWADSPTIKDLCKEINVDFYDDNVDLDDVAEPWEVASSRAFEAALVKRCKEYLKP